LFAGIPHAGLNACIHYTMNKTIIIKNILLISFASLLGDSRWAGNIRTRCCSKIGKLFGGEFTVSSIRLTLTGRIIVKDLRLRYQGKSMISITLLQGAISMRSALKRKLRLSYIFIDHFNFVIGAAGTGNADALFSPSASKAIPFAKLQRKHYKRLFSLASLLFEQVPSKVGITTAAVVCHFGKTNHEIFLENLSLQSNVYKVTCRTSFPGLSSFLLQGSIDKKQQLFTIEALNSSNPGNGFSFLIPNRNIFFISKRNRLSFSKKGTGQVAIQVSLQDSTFNWNALASKPLDVSLIELEFNCGLTADSFRIDNTSTLKYNEIEMNVSACHYFPEKNVFQAGVFIKDISIAQFLHSFPFFHFTKIYELTFEGTVSGFQLHFEFRLDDPSEYSFSVTTKPGELKLAERPLTWPDINDPFIHEVYDNGKFVRSIHLSDTNKHFLSIDKIPRLLSAIIAYTEDMNFERHCGVDPEFIGYAIIENLTARKFARGGSTITMQLVRNLFLGHNKTIYRKVEEIFITLLLENIFNLPKKRILELYLNIIEFAPGVYGIQEACEYYFLAPPNELCIQDFLVLSYIIPRPKYFLEAFMCSSEQLKCNLKNHIQNYSKRLCECGIITPHDVDALNWNIKIKGKVLSLNMPEPEQYIIT
jgi:hypothetical protein